MNYCNECNEGRAFYARNAHKLLKYVVIMKLIILITLLNLQLSFAAVKAQQITLSVKNASLKEVMSAIRKQSGYYFFVDAENTKLAKPVTVSLNQATIERTLEVIFADQPLKYEIDGKMIILTVKGSEKKPSLIEEQQQQGELTGVVLDNKGNPLAGATVILKEYNNKGTVTDGQGRYRFTNVPPNGTLLIRMIGRETKEIKYKNYDVAKIVLKEVDADLNEIQIIAYGQVQKRYSTSNMGSIKASDIAKQPITNPLLALQGRVPGLFIQQTTGNTIGNVNVTVQGNNSISNGNNPFYVIDGVPYPNSNLSGIEGGILRQGGNSTINFINPADIENVVVLKDADATAIYGSRAANGAILITTKRGKSGETKVDVNLQNGWGEITKTYNLLNTENYITIRKEALANDNKTIQTTDYDINGTWDQNRNINWQKEMAGGTAHYNNFSASISGGNENTQFRGSAGYIRQTTVYPADFVDNKRNVQLSVNHHSTNQKFTFNLSSIYLQDHNIIPTSDLFVAAISLAPNAPKLFNEDGGLNWSPSPSNPNVYTFDNPAKELLKKLDSKTNNLTANSLIGYKIIPGLELKISLGYNKIDNNSYNATPITYYKPDATLKPRLANYSNGAIASWIAEPQLTYEHQFTFGHLDALIGSSFQETKTDRINISASDFTNDAQLSNPMAAPTTSINGVLQSLYRYSAIFGRLNYRLKKRYIVNLTARRDATSRFGDNNKFHTFFAGAGAWIFTEEQWLKKTTSFLNFGKLRISYGTTGNDQISDYAYLSLYNNTNYGVNYQNSTGLVPSGLPNPYLQWEETKKLNVGIDLGFFNNKLLVNANYFRNRSSNQLIFTALPIITGFSNILSNLPASVQNSGFEFLIDLAPLKNDNVNWNISANLTIPRNKLLAFPGLSTSPQANSLVIGEPITLIKLYDFRGVDPQTGIYQFMSSKGELTSTPSSLTDRTKLITTLPKYYGGLTNSISYKNWNLDFLIMYVRQTKQNNRFMPLAPGVFNKNQPVTVLDRWKGIGDDATIQKITTNNISQIFTAQSSSAGYSNANFARLKNVSLSYTIPKKWLKEIHFSSGRIYVQGQNLLTITNFQGDPETGLINFVPPLRMYSVGLQFSL